MCRHPVAIGVADLGSFLLGRTHEQGLGGNMKVMVNMLYQEGITTSS